MKNHSILFLLLVGLFLIQACTVIQNNSSDVTSQTKLVTDDLYDNPVQAAAVPKKKKKSDYLDFQDDATLIEEENGLATSPEPNYLNSRAVYANQYDQGYANGFSSGLMNANPWNSWYTNPYISFGTGFGSRWASPLASWRLSDPYYFGSMSSMYGPMMYSSFAYQSSFMMNPYYYDPFYRMSAFSNPFNSMYGGMYGSMNGFGMYGSTNIYNYYGGLNSSYSSYNSNNYNVVDPVQVNRRGAREDGMSNRYGGENYNNAPRGNSNSYNSNGTNQQRVNSSATQVGGEAVVAPTRRNSNYEYQAAPQNSTVPQYQNRTESYSAPSTNYGNSSGGSFGGGSSSGGGSSRGPR
jgi:hypothetical protein